MIPKDTRQDMSINAYRRTMRESESPRQIERRLLSSVTGRMENVAQRYDHASSTHERLTILSEGLRGTLSENQAIWSALKMDLADPGNALPKDLRASLLSLAIFVERTTATVLGGAAGVGIMAEINNNIIDGLTTPQLARSA
jgi:flagellar biosynthesis activator protein FlaF